MKVCLIRGQESLTVECGAIPGKDLLHATSVLLPVLCCSKHWELAPVMNIGRGTLFPEENAETTYGGNEPACEMCVGSRQAASVGTNVRLCPPGPTRTHLPPTLPLLVSKQCPAT